MHRLQLVLHFFLKIWHINFLCWYVVLEENPYNCDMIFTWDEDKHQEKKNSMVNFLIFVQKNVSILRFQEIKIRP